MRRFLRPPLVWIVAALATLVAVLAISSATDEGGGPPPTTTGASAPPTGSTTTRHPAKGHRGGGHPGRTQRQVHQAVAQSPAARLDPEQRRIARVVRDYVAALNARNGRRACALFVPRGLAAVRFPRDRGGCAPSLSASIGYRDPRGFPVYDRSRVARIRAVAITASSARVTATVVTRFAEGREPSIEDDVTYLRRQGGRWLIVKPDATLYRAIGVGNIPPSVLAPP